LRVTVSAAADSGLTLLKGRDTKGQSNEKGESDDRFHGDQRGMISWSWYGLGKIVVKYSEWRADSGEMLIEI
jgi:hypothetical protein